MRHSSQYFCNSLPGIFHTSCNPTLTAPLHLLHPLHPTHSSQYFQQFPLWHPLHTLQLHTYCTITAVAPLAPHTFVTIFPLIPSLVPFTDFPAPHLVHHYTFCTHYTLCTPYTHHNTSINSLPCTLHTPCNSTPTVPLHLLHSLHSTHSSQYFCQLPLWQPSHKCNGATGVIVQ